MTEEHLDIRIKMAAVFVIIAASLAALGSIISWNRTDEIGLIIESVAVPFLGLAVYYAGEFDSAGKRVK